MALCESRHQSLSVCRARLSICQGTLFTENSALWISLGGDHRRSGSGAIFVSLGAAMTAMCHMCRCRRWPPGFISFLCGLTWRAKICFSSGQLQMLWTQLGELDMKHFELLQLQRQNNGKGMDMDGHGWTMEQALIVLPFVLAVVDFSELLVTHLEGSSEWVCLKMDYTVIYSYTVIPPKRPY